ncbi:MAG TPA: hypothetical protein VJ600_01455 [Holophagaceae bacterium]|nr:hypothetical protein [Holophagaceae bacterium]
MIKGKAPQTAPEGASAQGEDPKTAPGGVKLQKRAPKAPEPEAVREKACARCGTSFRVDPGKKFFLCPDCYRKDVTYKRRGGGSEARVMTLVTCSACGKSEYLSFVPEDRDKALCRDCFAKTRPEPNRGAGHSRRG